MPGGPQLALLVAAGATVALSTATASASTIPGHISRCSIYRAGPTNNGDAILTFANQVLPTLPGGAHGEPPYDCRGAAAQLTTADRRSTDEWSTSKPKRFRKPSLACVVHFIWIGEYVTATLRSIYPDDPVCGYLIQHDGP